MGRLGMIVGVLLGIGLIVGGIGLTVFRQGPTPTAQLALAQPSVVAPKIADTTAPATRTVVPPTKTPVPPTATIAATATPQPSPTVDPTIRAHAVKDVTVYARPDEAYKKSGVLASGNEVAVLYRGGQWFEVQANDVKGWVYREWIDLPDEQADRVPTYPDPMPVMVGKVVENYDYGYATYKGRVLNIGLKNAYRVKVEIEAFDKDNNRVALDSSFVDGLDLAPGQERSFMIMTEDNGIDTYILSVTWEEDTDPSA